jgi:hypothetical protein
MIIEGKREGKERVQKESNKERKLWIESSVGLKEIKRQLRY